MPKKCRFLVRNHKKMVTRALFKSKQKEKPHVLYKTAKSEKWRRRWGEDFTAVKRKNLRHIRLSLPWKSVSVQSVYGAMFVRKLCWKYSNKTKYDAIKSEVNKQELSTDTQRLKLLFPGTTSFDVLKKCFEFPGNLPPLNLFILRTRTAVDRCGGEDGLVMGREYSRSLGPCTILLPVAVPDCPVFVS